VFQTGPIAMSPVRHGQRTQAERSAETAAELIASARQLFVRQGYSATTTDQVAAAAGVTKGAVYHHFADKKDLFAAVFEREEEELSRRVSGAYVRKRDPWQAFEAGCRAFLEACVDPAVQRITLLDAPSALGWERVREIEAKHSLALIEGGLKAAMDAGRIPVRRVEAPV
jgi:AcrR family transcriptional regulator